MDIERLEITARDPDERRGTWASLDLYTYKSAGMMEAERLLTERGWSPYCLNADRSGMAFIKIPADIDLARVPFVVFTQFKLAEAMTIVPLEVVNQLASRLPPPPNLLMIFMIGRSGSTLINQLLSHVTGVGSYSEPEIFKDLTLLAQDHTLGHAAWDELVRSTVRLWQHVNGSNHTLGMKLARLATGLLPHYYRALPDARYILSYRHGVSWAHSNYGHLQRTYVGLAEHPDLVPVAVLRTMWRDLVSDDTTPIEAICDEQGIGRIEDFYATAWLAFMSQFEHAMLLGMPALGVEYETLVHNDRAATLRALLRFCGLPPSAYDEAIKGFEHDAQRGSYYGKNKKTYLSEPQIQRFLGHLSAHPRFSTPDARLSAPRRPS